MGRLIKGTIPAFYHGVSRQPDSVRAPGQVEEMKNCMPSIVHGGFEKRAGTQHQMEITGYQSGATPWFHHYNRDGSEQYIVSVEQITNSDPVIRVFDVVNYTEKTVTILDSVHVFADEQDSTTTVTGTGIRTYKASGETQIDLTISGVAGGLTVQVQTAPDSSGVPGSWTTRATLTTNGTSTVTMEEWLRVNVTVAGTGTFVLTGTYQSLDYLANTTDGMGFSAVTISDYTLIANNSVTTSMRADPTAVTTFGPAQAWSHLPRVQETVSNYLKGYAAGATWVAGDTGANTNDVWKVSPDNATKDQYYWAKLLDDSASVWEWEETADPNFSNTIDPFTMPYQLVRLANGNFEFGPATWNDRETGDPVVVPNPDFIGDTVTCLTFYRDRLGIISGETAYFSAQGDYFNMFALSALDVIDTDPFGLVASSGRVSLIKRVANFRRSLFLTAASTQFEVSGDVLFTPSRAAMDYSTSYDVETAFNPIALGDTLFFASTVGERTLIFEYFYDEASVSNTANEVTTHSRGYIPDGAKWMTGDPTQNHLILAVDDGTVEELYFYSFYWTNREKQMESFHKWVFQSDTEILYMAHIDEPILTLVLRRTSGEVYIETIDLSTNDIQTLDPSYNVRLDQRTYLNTGSYNAGNDETTFTLPWEHDSDTGNIIAIASSDYAAGTAGLALDVTLSSTNTVTVPGDYSAGNVIFGRLYDSEVTLSTIYWRADEQRNKTDGRLQLKDMTLDFEDTAEFEVEVTPEARTALQYEMNGNSIGGALTFGSVSIVERGTFRFPIRTENLKATIVIKNNSYTPSRITSATWRGFYNEYTAQETTPRRMSRVR